MTTLQWRIEETSPGRGRFYIACERGVQGECSRSIWSQPAQGVMWQWDGNREQPTITPSIDCKGGCGRHFTMTQGVPR